MTAAVWDDLAPAPEPPRDRWGRYLITPADGGKAIGHIRATTFAKTVAEESALAAWKQRMTALGLAARPDLLAAIATTNPDDKKALDGICERALEHGGGTARRDLGTAIHAGTERHDKGQPHGLPDPWGRDVDAYAAAMQAIGATIDPRHIERICVVADLTVAGTFDRLVTVDGRLAVADLKTGSGTYGAQEWAIQLALYANADTLWTPIDDVHEPMPAVDRAKALIIHLPAGEARCDVYTLDVAAGWDMVQTCATVRQWRKRRDLLVKVESAEAPAPPTVIPLTVAPAPAPAVDLLAPPPPPEPRPVGALEAAARQDRIDHLRGRLVALLDAHGAHATNLVATARPDWLPTFADEREHPGTLDATHLDEWAKIITNAEAAVGQPFTPDPDPAGPLLRDDDRIADLRARVQALPADLREQVQDDAEAAGIPRLTSGKATVTHLDQVAALIDAAEAAARQRAMIAVTHMAALPDSVTSAWVAETIGTDPSAPIALLTDVQLEHLGDLADACLPEAGPLLVADGDGLAAHPDALDLLVARFGGRSPLLAEAKRLAGALGIDKPKASTDVVASIPLVARLAVTDVAA